MKIIALYLLISFSFATLVNVTAQDIPTYLRQNSLVFTGSQPASYQLFDSTFYQNEIFLLGEVHGYAVPQQIDLALIKHLHERVGLRYYLAEMDMGQAALLNGYMDTGNPMLLDSLFQGFLAQTYAGTSQWGNQQFYDKLVSIQTYNQTLPVDKHIRFLGVDWFQSKNKVAVSYIKQIVQERITAPVLNPLLDSLRILVAQDSLNLKKLAPFASRVNTDYTLHKEDYQLIFGNQLLNFRQFFETLSCADRKMSRDDVAAHMTQFLIRELGLEHEKLYGLWGMTHILQAGVNQQQTFSGLLKSAGKRVVSLQILYKDSEMLIHRSAVPFVFRKRGEEFVRMKNLNSDGPVFKTEGFSDLEPFCQPNAVTLFRLNRPGSPYTSALHLVKVGGMTGSKIKPNEAERTVTTDYFQYAFVVLNSPSVELWKPSL